MPTGLTFAGNPRIYVTLPSSNAPTKLAPIPSLTALNRMIIEANAPSITLEFCAPFSVPINRS